MFRVIQRYAWPGRSCKAWADDLKRLAEMPAEDLTRFYGMTTSKALSIIAVMELADRGATVSIKGL